MFSACSGAGGFSGDDAAMGTVALSLNPSSNGRAAVEPKDVLNDLTYEVTMEGPTGTQNSTLDKGKTNANFKLSAGLWKITVKAYYCEELFGTGSSNVNVKAGQNNPVTITMKGSDITFFVAAGKADWNQAISEMTNGGKYVINITGDFSTSISELFGTFGKSQNDILTGINVIINGNSKTLTSDGGCLLYIRSGQTVTIRDLKLVGRSDNTTSLVKVYGGTLTMEGSASVYNNKIQPTSNTSTFENGGGVYVNGGTFNMHGGVVSGNKAYGTNGNGGGVYVVDGGTFNISNGTVYGSGAGSQLANSVDNGGLGAALFVASGGTARIVDSSGKVIKTLNGTYDNTITVVNGVLK